MSGSGVALAIIFVIILAGTLIGILAGRRRKMDLAQWTVAGRGFGLVLVWLLTAGVSDHGDLPGAVSKALVGDERGLFGALLELRGYVRGESTRTGKIESTKNFS